MARKRKQHRVYSGEPVRVACVNKAKTDFGVSFEKLTAALQKCYDQHFLPVWGYPLELYITKRPHVSDWQFIYFDNADQADALGYHGLTKRGQPVSKIFVETTINDGGSVSVTASHELFEMAMDPIANLWAQARNGMEYAYEVCDPVEEDTFKVDGLDMCSFVYPAWFEPFKHPRRTKFDHLGTLSRPFSIAKGGYVIKKRGSRMKEVFGSRSKRTRFDKKDRVGHRGFHRKADNAVDRRD